MKRHTFRSAVILLVLLALPALVAAQEYKGKARLKGTVVNPEGQPLKDAMVTAVYSETGTGPDAVKVKGNGEFEVKDLKSGTWTFTAAAGHLGYGSEMTGAEVLERDTPEISIVVQPAQALLQEGTTKLQSKNFAEARAAFEKLLIAFPENLALNQPIALSYQGEGNHAKALEHIDIVLESMEGAALPDPTALTQVKLQAIFSTAQIPDLARMHGYIDTLSDAEFTDETTAALVEVSANMLGTEQKNYEESVKVLDIVVSKVPAAPLPYYYRGMAYRELENPEMVKADLEKCVELSTTETAQVKQAKIVLEQMNPGS